MQVIIDPNWFAYVALFGWPLIALYLYSRMSVQSATLWTILGGFLLLPVALEVKIPMVPAFNKETIPNIAAVLGCLFIAQKRPRFVYGFGVTEIFLLVLILSPFITSIQNTDDIWIGGRVLPGVGLYDAGSAVIFQIVFMLPFFFGRQFFRKPEDTAEILKVLVIAGLGYSLLMLFEIRMSPQLHTWVYGYFPNSFLQQVRGTDSFRPVVFLGHGLVVAFFGMTTAVAAATLWRCRIRVVRSAPPSAVTAYLSVVLVLCRTWADIIYGALLIPLIRLASQRLQIRVACILVLIAISYPLLRAADAIPTTYLLNMAGSVNEAREDSLKTRFVQEQRLLDKAWQRIWFGWGRFGRNRIYNEETGGNESITDGAWIIVVGTFGLVGFAAVFGLLALTVFRAAAALKYVQSTRDGMLLTGLALIVSINMIDLLPNSSLSCWTWLLAGSLLGRADALYASARHRAPLSHLKASKITFQRPVAGGG
jgi:hypothetical protein